MKIGKNIIVLSAIAILIVVGGCRKGIERVSIDGTVTFEGKPLDGGYLTIRPVAGPGTGTAIKSDGTYKISKESGPMAGECEISIERFKTQSITGSDGRESTVSEPTLPEKIQGKPKNFTLKNGNNKIDLDLDTW
ncbi:MAG: hypothetical protein LBJ00_14875 [Planctomycetaceae bacterium]|jgi:hypothetical protein|nr:hypothetical protein [Planctomycetaceae bacterium]